MPFIPHTPEDIKEMLDLIGIQALDDLFSEIPASLRLASFAGVPTGISEMALFQDMQKRAWLDDNLLCFLGAGAYQHYIPAAVWEIATRGEFMTAYTPYQAEASQGTLQLIYEYQTMMASLMGLEVSNASLYDGASALAEAILMAVRLQNKKGNANILMPKTVHPHYRQTVQTIIQQQDIQIVDIPYITATGRIDLDVLKQLTSDSAAALIIPQPNFFGVIEEVDALVNFAAEKNIFSIGVVNPISMALLKPPGEWGDKGVDIACGEGQPLGIPLASGGPYYGFLCCKKALVRQMPGRVVGRTVDLEGKPGYVLTLQAREQHIRRAKATSNICTNQGLMVTASTIYMSLMGPQGLRDIAMACHERTRELTEALTAIPGVRKIFNAPYFNEVVMQVDKPTTEILSQLAKHRIQAGYALTNDYPELGDCLLICATEMKTAADIDLLAKYLSDVMQGGKVACHA